MKHFVYPLSSINNPNKSYTGQTSRSVFKRRDEHNRGMTAYTKRMRPWRIVVSVGGFVSKAAAMRFERLWKHRSRGGLVEHLLALVRLMRVRDDVHVLAHVKVGGIDYKRTITVATAAAWISAEEDRVLAHEAANNDDLGLYDV